MSYHKVMVGADCYGCGDSHEHAQRIVQMHRTVKSGHRKETKASTLDFKIVEVQGNYPTHVPIVLNYKPGKSGELK